MAKNDNKQRIQTIGSVGVYEGRGFRLYSGFVRASELFKLGFKDNPRDPLARSRASKSIPKTLREHASWFAAMHSGVALVARKARRVSTCMELDDSSIVNGAQSIATLRRNEAGSVDLCFTLCETTNEEMIRELGGTLNTTQHLKDLSLMGHRGQLDALEKAIGDTITKSESDPRGDRINTYRAVEAALTYHSGVNYIGENALKFAEEHELLGDAEFLRQVPIAWRLAQHVVTNPAFDKIKKALKSEKMTWPASIIRVTLYAYGQCAKVETPDSMLDEEIMGYLKTLRRQRRYQETRHIGGMPPEVKTQLHMLFDNWNSRAKTEKRA